MLKRSRESLSEILGYRERAGTDLFNSTFKDVEKMHRVYRSKISDGISEPVIVVPSSGDLEDFFATLAAYYQDRTPITSLAYVLSEELSGLALEFDDGHLVENCAAARARNACHGAALGEASLLKWANLTADAWPDFATTKRTLSFALCRAATIYGARFRGVELLERWSYVQQWGGYEVDYAATEVALTINSIVFPGQGVSKKTPIDPLLADAVRCFAQDDIEGAFRMEASLISMYPDLASAFKQFKGAFDGRMSAFSSAITTIERSSSGARANDIAVGYVCSRIQPGSFDHMLVLKHLQHVFPAANVWYGMFAACSVSARERAVPVRMLVKLERDALAPFSVEVRPQCDIAFEELEILSRTTLGVEDVSPSLEQAAIVGLMPGVNLVVPHRAKSAKRPDNPVAMDRIHKATALLDEAIHVLRGGGNVSGGGAKPNTTKRRV